MIYLEVFFWISLVAVLYSYLGYPSILFIVNKIIPKKKSTTLNIDHKPTVSIIIPVHNEGNIIDEKILNTLKLFYPDGKIEILIVSDGSTDNTKEIAHQYHQNVNFYELQKQSGKAAALNLGMKKAKNDIIIFSDASIMLGPDAIINIVKNFIDPKIGCVSGEDHIKGNSGEGLYGKYELLLRNLESHLHSIVGASGSFYAQRKLLCQPFEEGLAPDFLSVLNTVEQGYRAITEPSAIGYMSVVKSNKDEFSRKVRTLVRGMTALFTKRNLLNPIKYPVFSFQLFSHKIARWLVPFFLLILIVSNLFLIGNKFYLLLFLLQVIFYLLAICAYFGITGLSKIVVGKLPLFFLIVNVAIIVAWWKYLRGTRQEIWAPSKR